LFTKLGYGLFPKFTQDFGLFRTPLTRPQKKTHQKRRLNENRVKMYDTKTYAGAKERGSEYLAVSL